MKNNIKIKSGAETRMTIKKICDSECIAAKNAYKETMEWFAQNPDKTTEETIEHFEKTKQTILNTDFYSIQAFKTALTDKSLNL